MTAGPRRRRAAEDPATRFSTTARPPTACAPRSPLCRDARRPHLARRPPASRGRATSNPCCPERKSTVSSPASRQSTSACRRRSTATPWCALPGACRARPVCRCDCASSSAAEKEREGLAALLDDPEMGPLASDERRALDDAHRAAHREGAAPASAQGRCRREERDPRSPRRHRRGRGGALRRRSLPHVSALCGSAGLEGARSCRKARATSAATRKSSPTSAAAASSRG